MDSQHDKNLKKLELNELNWKQIMIVQMDK